MKTKVYYSRDKFVNMLVKLEKCLSSTTRDTKILCSRNLQVDYLQGIKES